MITGAIIEGNIRDSSQRISQRQKLQKNRFFVTKICKILAFARFSSFNASPIKRRLSLSIYNCLIMRLSLRNASLPATLSKQSTPVPVMGRLLLKYHQRVGYSSSGRVEISLLKWGRRTTKFEKPWTKEQHRIKELK